MSKKLSSLIRAEELLRISGKPKLVLIDARSGPDGKASYMKKHLQGALHVDLDTQMSEIKDDAAKGGRHPLPSVEQFARTLAGLGISKDSHVVIYDDKNGANAAARFWWMLRSLGHEEVQVLNGGFSEAEKSGFPMSSQVEQVEKAEPYVADDWKLPLSEIMEVEKAAQSENRLVIDVRAPKRYAGEWEPIDLIAGHIPGALNVPFASNLNEKGLFLSPAELREKYLKLLNNKPIENVIVHCGSGVTACHTLLALDHAGLEIPKLYVGSWSEWSRNNKAIESSGN